MTTPYDPRPSSLPVSSICFIGIGFSQSEPSEATFLSAIIDYGLLSEVTRTEYFPFSRLLADNIDINIYADNGLSKLLNTANH